MISTEDDLEINGSHRIKIIADKMISEIDFNEYDCMILPGGKVGTQRLEDNQYLMEIKVLGSMPLWLSEALNELKIYPHSFSKYAQAMAKYMPEGVNTTATLKEEKSHAHKYIGKYSYNFT